MAKVLMIPEQSGEIAILIQLQESSDDNRTELQSIKITNLKTFFFDFLLKYFLDQTLHWCFKLHWVKLWFVFSLNVFLGVSLSGIYDESIISWSYSESYFGFGRNFVKTWIEFSHLTLFLILRVLPELAQR